MPREGPVAWVADRWRSVPARRWRRLGTWANSIAIGTTTIIALFAALPPTEKQYWFGATYEQARILHYVTIGVAAVVAVVALISKLSADWKAAQEQQDAETAAALDRAKSRAQISERFTQFFRSYGRSLRSGWDRSEAHQFTCELLDQLNHMLDPAVSGETRCVYYSFAADERNEVPDRLNMYAHSTGGAAPRRAFSEADALGKHIIGKMKANQDVTADWLNNPHRDKSSADPVILNDPRYRSAARPYSSFVSKPIRDTLESESDGLLGMLTVDFLAGEGPTPEQQRILSSYALILTAAIVGSEQVAVRALGPTRPKEAQG